jgi:hypothetical protein
MKMKMTNPVEDRVPGVGAQFVAGLALDPVLKPDRVQRDLTIS